MTPLLTTRSLSVALGRRRVVEAADLSLRAGEVVGLIGPNGAGKSTLLRALASLLPYEGRILLEGHPLERLSAEARARLIGFLPQDGGIAWAITVEALVRLGRIPYCGPFRALSARDHAMVERALQVLDLETFRARPVTQLSGGERARALLARVLAGEPRLLLADEPAAGLDPAHQLGVMRELRALAGQGTAVVVVLHDLTLAARFCDRLLLLHQGRLTRQGPPLEVLAAPETAASYGVRLALGTLEGETVVLPSSR